MPRGEPTHLHIFDFVELGNRSPSIRNYSSVEVVDRASIGCPGTLLFYEYSCENQFKASS